MGTNSLVTQTDATVIDVADVNQFKTALTDDIVPRNTAGVPTDVGAKCGTGTYRFSEAHSNKYYIGENATNTLESDGAGTVSLIADDGMILDAQDDILIKHTDTTVATFTSGGMTKASMVSVGQQISASCGTFSRSGSVVSVTNLSVTITTTGRPVIVGIVADGTGSPAVIGVSTESTTAQAVGRADLTLIRGATPIAATTVLVNCYTSGSVATSIIPAPFLHFDAVAAGTYTYYVTLSSSTGDTAYLEYCKLIAYEL